MENKVRRINWLVGLLDEVDPSSVLLWICVSDSNSNMVGCMVDMSPALHSCNTPQELGTVLTAQDSAATRRGSNQRRGAVRIGRTPLVSYLFFSFLFFSFNIYTCLLYGIPI